MNDDAFQSDLSDALSPDRHIDRICDRFEAAWKRGARPKIESYVTKCPEARTFALLSELFPIDLLYRNRDGERPGREEYVARFPGYAAGIAQAFEEVEQQLESDADTPELASPPGPFVAPTIRLK